MKIPCNELPELLLPYSIISILSNVRNRLDAIYKAVAQRVECSSVQVEVLERLMMFEQPRREVLAKTLVEIARNASEKSGTLDCNTLILVAEWLAVKVRRYRSDLSYTETWDDLRSSLALYASKLSEAKVRCEATTVENVIAVLRELSKAW